MKSTMKTSKIHHRKNLLPVYLKGLVSGKYTLKQASESTGYTVVHLCNLKKRYKEIGWDCLEHHGKGKVPANKFSEEKRQQIAMIYSTDFKDVNFAYFRLCLDEIYNIKISAPTLKNILNQYGLVSPEARNKKRRRPAKRYRIRRENEGDLLQIDGTPYPWFYKSGDKKRYCIMGAIDDATGKITGLYMCANECLYGYMEMLKTTCEKYGVPRQIYSDRAAIFCVTAKKDSGVRLSKYDQLEMLHSERTQWQRMLRELDIEQILAWSPEAKGRVERMWRTLQGQLPQWLYMHKITTMEQANKVLMNYADEFNRHYAKSAAKNDLFYLPMPTNLEDILQCRISRQTDAAGVFSFHAYKFDIPDCPYPCRRKIELCISSRGVFARVDGLYYNIRPLDEYLEICIHENKIPQVLQDIMNTYLYSFAKRVSI